MTDINCVYINGAWVVPESMQTMPILNPATNGQIGTLTLGNAADVGRAVALAAQAADVGRWRSAGTGRSYRPGFRPDSV
jgi:aldehyde dehydrogenase (NAD+)